MTTDQLTQLTANHYEAAYQKLDAIEKARIDRMVASIIHNLKAERAWVGLSRNGALELLSKLGIFMIDHPTVILKEVI